MLTISYPKNYISRFWQSRNENVECDSLGYHALMLKNRQDGWEYRAVPPIIDTSKQIDNDAFNGCSSLTTITIPEGVTNLQNCTFQDCKALESVSIPSSIKSIDRQTFYGCYNITSVTIKRKKPLSIDYFTFPSRSIATLYVPYGCKTAYEEANYWKDFNEIKEMNLLGDVNGDGEITAQDASLILQYVAGKTLVKRRHMTSAT